HFQAVGSIGAVTQTAFDLAPPQHGLYTLADLRLDGPQRLRQAHADIQITMVDAAQFPGQFTPVAGSLCARKASHAPNHVSVRHAQRGREYRTTGQTGGVVILRDRFHQQVSPCFNAPAAVPSTSSAMCASNAASPS